MAFLYFQGGTTHKKKITDIYFRTIYLYIETIEKVAHDTDSHSDTIGLMQSNFSGSSG